MKKIHKIADIILLFIIAMNVLCCNAYGLRAPSLFQESSDKAEETRRDDIKDRELPRTNPLKFNPDNFTWLIKSSASFRYYKNNRDAQIENLEIASLACIDKDHRGMYLPYGYILDVPDENILARYDRDVDSGWNKKEENIFSVIERIDVILERSNLSDAKHDNLRDVLVNTRPNIRNEIIVRMKNVRITGMFYKTGTSDYIIKKLKKEAIERNIPLFELGKESKVIYMPTVEIDLEQLKPKHRHI